MIGVANIIKIKKVEANSLYQVNNGYKNARLDLGIAVINDSLFANYMIKHGVTINKRNKSADFIAMSFEYGTKADENNLKMTADELRNYYYKNGATVTWETYNKEGKIVKIETVDYKMLMRSTGKAKEGDCIFIRDCLYDVAISYLTMGLHDKMPMENAKIVEMSAYAPLTTATAIDYITIPMENILIVKDEKVSTMFKAVTVKVKEDMSAIKKLDYAATEKYINKFNMTFYEKKKKKNPELQCIKKSTKALKEKGIDLDKCTFKKKMVCYVDRGNSEAEVANTLWDGMGIIDDSIFPNNMEGFIYCRNHFFKSCLFRGNMQEYFKDWCKANNEDYETKRVKDMFGNWFYLKNIKVITTDNSIKWIGKFNDLMGKTDKATYRYYKKIIKKHNNQFAIVKTAHPSKWGNLQRGSFQIYNSLPTTNKNALRNIAKDSIDYCNKLKTSHDFFMKHLEITGSAYSINSVLIALDKLNDKFKYTEFFINKKNKIISEFKRERLQLGKLFQQGDNLTICGNVIALLMKVTGVDPLKEPCFYVEEDGIQCYTTRFKDGERIAGFRSPHNSPNNIVHLINTYPELLKRYFPKLGNNVIVINGIGTDVQDRLNGQDLDTDSIFATNQPDIVELAKKAYTNCPTIINKIGLRVNNEYNHDMESYARMDNSISSAQLDIGNASNKAQLALSYYYDDGGKNEELEDVFIICSVLAQAAIDGCKREYEVDVKSELNRLSKLPCMKREKKYPRFYDDIQKDKPRYKIKAEQVGNFNCPMDILYWIVNNGVIDGRKEKSPIEPYAWNEVFSYKYDESRRGVQYKKIISIVEEYDKNVKKLHRDNEDYSKYVGYLFDDSIKKMKNLKITQTTMSALILYAVLAPNGGICSRLLTVLYNKDSETFLKCFKKC